MKVTDVEQFPAFTLDELLNDDGRRAQEGYRIWAALSIVSATNQFPEKHQQLLAIRKHETKILAEGIIVFSSAWIRDFCFLCDQLRVYAAQLPGDTEIPMDDPAVRWSRIEQLLQMKLFFAAEQILPEILRNQPTIGLADRIRLVEARADLGESQFTYNSEIFSAEHGELYRSILNAHHQHPYNDADIQRCFDYMEKVPGNSPAGCF